MTKRLQLEVLAMVQLYRNFFQNPKSLNAVKYLPGFSFTSGTLIIATNMAREATFNTVTSVRWLRMQML